ncbi:MAG: hemerythrin domain-containing protein [Magnetococcales bacterium]|nr:hemerythrin domain-containing protein [Magnetococcales bacterium]
MPAHFYLGHPTIDVQHEVLFALYHEVRHALQEADDSFEVADVFLGLNLYVATHLQFEEEAMFATGYPDALSHRMGHQDLREGIHTLYEEFLNASSLEESRTVAARIAVFLYEWLENHIAKVDRVLCRYLLDHAFEG